MLRAVEGGTDTLDNATLTLRGSSSEPPVVAAPPDGAAGPADGPRSDRWLSGGDGYGEPAELAIAARQVGVGLPFSRSTPDHHSPRESP